MYTEVPRPPVLPSVGVTPPGHTVDMTTTESPWGEGYTSGGAERVDLDGGRWQPGRSGRVGTVPVDRVPHPLGGAALLDRLRVTGLARPTSDPDLVADLRSHIEDASALMGVDGASLVVTPNSLADALACPAHAPDRTTPKEFSLPLACGALVGALFRQFVTTGTVDDAFAEGVEALAVDEHRAPLVAWIGDLAPAERAELRAEVVRQAEGLRGRWPALDPAWLPRTRECVRVSLSGGVELVTRVDLAIGRPTGAEASVAFVEVTTGSRRAVHRDVRRFQALMETLRSAVPPFAVATYFTRTGELEVDPVTPELLVAAARRCRAGIEAIISGRDVGAPTVGSPAPGSDAYRWCAGCAEAPLGRTAPVATIEALPAPSVPVAETNLTDPVAGGLAIAGEQAA